jgi:hypothetical protein
MASELIQYAEDFFANNYNGTKIENNDENSRMITLSYEARSDFREFVHNSHLSVSHLGHKQDSILCIFNNDNNGYKKWKTYELIDLNHPFIKCMKFVNKEKTFAHYDCSAIKLGLNTAAGINKGLYVYYIQKWSGEGYRNMNELRYFLIDTETEKIIDDNISEKLVISALTKGADYSEIKYGLDFFDRVLYSLEKCREHANNEFLVFGTNFYNENVIICERNIGYLSRTFERKKSSIQEQINKARQSGLPEKILRMHEGKLRKAEDVYKIQLRKIESRKTGRCAFSDIAVGLIQVGG